MTGKLFDPETGLGAVWTFRLYGFIAFAVMVLYIIANMTVFRRPLHMHAPRNMSIEIDANKPGIEVLFYKTITIIIFYTAGYFSGGDKIWNKVVRSLLYRWNRQRTFAVEYLFRALKSFT